MKSGGYIQSKLITGLENLPLYISIILQILSISFGFYRAVSHPVNTLDSVFMEQIRFPWKGSWAARGGSEERSGATYRRAPRAPLPEVCRHWFKLTS